MREIRVFIPYRSNVETKGGPVSVANHVRALQDSGLGIASSKRISRDLSSLPRPPHSPQNTTSPIQPTTEFHFHFIPFFPQFQPYPSNLLRHRQPSYRPSSCQRLPSVNHLLDLHRPCLQYHPQIISLPGSNAHFQYWPNRRNRCFLLYELESALAHNKFTDHGTAGSPVSALASLTNFQVPMERPSSTPIASVLSQAGLRRRRSRLLLKHSELSGSGTAPKSGSYLPVLLIDVREWAAFDREHIKASAVVCIESHVLRRSA
ncbi:hypothetical protein BDQ12DRAFT_22532 [Crucibulum laeve]|uniref:Rhodanese domain-containing protein n=1 Tax=Crucibulum laeve TaxID=68775 RepID=A0A5C3MKS9_9AGAR|nr:hypothetical protein BDQ12DRAFT_22532 [Crucibulum laeve]